MQHLINTSPSVAPAPPGDGEKSAEKPKKQATIDKELTPTSTTNDKRGKAGKGQLTNPDYGDSFTTAALKAQNRPARSRSPTEQKHETRMARERKRQSAARAKKAGALANHALCLPHAPPLVAASVERAAGLRD